MMLTLTDFLSTYKASIRFRWEAKKGGFELKDVNVSIDGSSLALVSFNEIVVNEKLLNKTIAMKDKIIFRAILKTIQNDIQKYRS